MSAVLLNDVEGLPVNRISCGIEEIDYIYGNNGHYGLPIGKISLWAGEYGIGKTRLIASILLKTDKENFISLLFQNEISPSQFKSEKLYGRKTNNIWISDSSLLISIINEIKSVKPKLCIIDSIQQINEYKNGRGSKIIIRSLRDAIANLDCHIIIISQLSSNSQIKGGTELPHEVDIVADIKSCENTQGIISGNTIKNFFIEIHKNRYGRSGRNAIFQHEDEDVLCLSNNRREDIVWLKYKIKSNKI